MTDLTATDFAAPRTDAERAVLDAVTAEGVHAVVFWAAWCGNSISQLERDLASAVEAHPDVSFMFVSLWDEGRTGETTLRAHGVPARARAVGQPGVGEDAPKAERDLTFLGLPVTWIPSTWVLNRGGRLATAFNYGEVTRAQLDAALASAASGW